MRSNAQILVDALREPQSTLALNGAGWADLISMARAESLAGSLAYRLVDIAVPEAVKPVLQDSMQSSELARQQALWEAESARRALSSLSCKILLMKGTAYVAANCDAGIGRSIGDLDIMVDRSRLPEAEEALLDAGWEWVKPDPYDDQYYREHMHELPPLIHRERDRMIDVHHTILPLTARPAPCPKALLDDAQKLDSGLYVMGEADMVLHSVAHMLADGDMAGGLRNLWDIDRLVRQFSRNNAGFWKVLHERAQLHGLEPHLARALRLAARLYDLPTDKSLTGVSKLTDYFYVRRLLARDGWGRESRKVTRQLFYIRSHWLRMPPVMLARHLWTKWRKK